MAEVLVLNKHFLAIAVTNWRRALGLLYLNHALVVDQRWRTYDFHNWVDLSMQFQKHPAGFVHTPRLRIAIPEVITLKLFGLVPQREVTFSRRNLYHYYGHRCCYCGRFFPSSELTLDHILPRSRGGKTDWLNVIPSCIPCNKRKGNRLPSEAGMKLHLNPHRPEPRTTPLGPTFAKRRSWEAFLGSLDFPSEGQA